MDAQACARCFSNDVVPDAEIRDYDASSYRPLSAFAERAKKEGGSFLGLSVTKASGSATLHARVCGACGHVELFSPEAAALWAAYSGGPD